MLIHQTTEKLRAMKLPAMAAEYLRQSESTLMENLDFDERIGMLADAEWLARKNNRIRKLARDANLREANACFADIDYRAVRKLDRQAIARLTDFAWVKETRNLIVTGATGTGKTWLVCAFGQEACRMGIRTRFYRMSRLINELTLATGSGNLAKALAKLAQADILILDDWGLNTIPPAESRLLLEVFEDRFGIRSTIIAAQLPVSKWHDLFEDKTIADAILDRLVHNAHRFEIHGPSMRSRQDKKHTAELGHPPINGTNGGEAY
jgi:DNA replication protein DnaC